MNLMAHVEVAVSQPTWSYKVFNDEPASSPNHIKCFHLDVDASITVTGTPPGWGFDTDGSTFVVWFNTEESLPHANDIAPGASLDGFQIESALSAFGAKPSGLFAWDHTDDVPGPMKFDRLVVPVAI